MTPLDDEATERLVRAPARPRRLLGATSAVALAALAWVAGRGLATAGVTQRVLRVRAIEVRGIDRLSRDEVLTTAGLGGAPGILGVPLVRGVAALEALPWVRRAAIRRQLPDRLRVTVEEHTAKLSVQLGELWLVNPDGEPFKRFVAKDDLVLPMVTGLHAAPAHEVPLHAQGALVGKLREALTLLDALAEWPHDIARIDALHHDPDLGWSVELAPAARHAAEAQARPVRAHLGSAAIERLPVLVAALAELGERRLVPRTLWAANARQAGAVQVELAAARPPPALPAARPRRR